MEHQEYSDLLAELERDLPDIDIASLEYFTTFPFDSRLEQLLNNEPPEVRITSQGASDQFLDDPLFPPNEINEVDITLDDDEVISIKTPRYTYNLEGVSTYDGMRLSVDLRVNDGIMSAEGVAIKDVPDHNNVFIAYRINPDASQVTRILSTKELIRTLCLLGNVEAAAAKKALQHIEQIEKNPDSITLDHTIYQEYFMHLWNRLGQENDTASRSETRKIIHEIPTSNKSQQEVLRLEQIEEESSDNTILVTTLEYAKIYTELDVEDTYTLTLVFTKEDRGTLTKSASRIICSGADAYSLKRAKATQKAKGKETALDINDPSVQQLFVDWFDQLVSA